MRVANTWADVTPQAGQCLSASIYWNPTNLTQVEGIGATFNVAAIANGPTYQWQVSGSGSSTWTNISNAVGATYTTPNLWIASDNENKYRAIVSSACDGSSATSAVATVTLTPPVITPTGLIMYDNFSDLQRYNLPVTTNNSVWYTAVTNYLDSSSGKLIGTPLTGSSSLWWGQFVDESNTNLPVHLDINCAIKVTLPFTPLGFAFHTNNGPMRFGLFDYADGGVLLTNDSSLATGKLRQRIERRGLYVKRGLWQQLHGGPAPVTLGKIQHIGH